MRIVGEHDFHNGYHSGCNQWSLEFSATTMQPIGRYICY